MKLKDCTCGGIPQVTEFFNDHIEFVVGCPACGNQTPTCKNLIEAISLWNQIYCCTLPPYEIELT
jgi:hypothetical protein